MRFRVLQVCPCICFCHYVEQQLQEMHDNAEILVTRIMEEKQELLQQQQQNGDGQSSHPQQQQEHMLSNGHSSYDGQQQRQSTASANGGPYGPRGSSSGGSLLQQQQRQITLETAALAAMAAAATTKLRVLSRVISDFSSCRREWVLKLGKAIATGFMHKASGAGRRGCAAAGSLGNAAARVCVRRVRELHVLACVAACLRTYDGCRGGRVSATTGRP